MLIYPNILSDSTLNLIHLELSKYKGQMVWNLSDELWQKPVATLYSGIATAAFASDEVWRAVVEDIKHILPECKALSMQYNIWHRAAAAPLHDDEGYSFAATIYLNLDWHRNWGGLLLWLEDPNSNLVKGIFPTYNTLVLNKAPLKQHLVTPISAGATETRMTLQLWAQ